MNDISKGLWIFGKCWRRVMEYPQKKKEGLLESMNTLLIPRNMALLF